MQALDLSRHHYTITGAFRVGDIRHACADVTQAQRALDWQPKVGLPDGLTQLAHWAREELKIVQKG